MHCPDARPKNDTKIRGVYILPLGPVAPRGPPRRIFCVCGAFLPSAAQTLSAHLRHTSPRPAQPAAAHDACGVDVEPFPSDSQADGLSGGGCRVARPG